MLRVCRGWQTAVQLSRALPANLHTSAPAPSIQLNMPSLSPTMADGTIVKWLKVSASSFRNYFTNLVYT